MATTAARPATGARYWAPLVGAAFWELVAEAPLPPEVPDEAAPLVLLAELWEEL